MSVSSPVEPAWDVIVIGAGPAGSVTARELARGGCRVLLVEKASFPRPKVCGSCLSGIAVEQLVRLGLEGTLAGAVPLNRVLISSGHRRAPINLPRGVALSREVFDARLVEEAIISGVTFRQRTLAKIGKEITWGQAVHLNGQTEYARAVVVATGLSNQEASPAVGSRIGASTIIPRDWSCNFFDPGTVYMATSHRGYVGLVRVEDDRLDVAAAFDGGFIKERGGLGEAAEAILTEVGWPIPTGLATLNWRGTPALTRKPARIACRRFFAVGDAAGYIEPFTGEGMAWAILSACILAPIAVRAAHCWNDDLAREWQDVHARFLGPRQWRCQMIARLLRSYAFRHLAIRALSLFPMLARPLVVSLNHSRRLPQPARA